MAKFEIEEGEQVVRREWITTLSEKRAQIGGQLILTDRRVVVVGGSGSGMGLFSSLGLFGVLRLVFKSLVMRGQVAQQIHRDDFATAEVRGKTGLRVRSKGEAMALPASMSSSGDLRNGPIDWISGAPGPWQQPCFRKRD